MSVLVVGLSHRSAPLALLERASLGRAAQRGLEAAACAGEHVAEAFVLSTCNRLEVYADVSKFHAGIADVGAALAAATGVALDELTEHLYVHYEDAAVQYLFTVACGLDSMAVGEAQILGQVRSALRASQEAGRENPAAAGVGRVVGGLAQHALRVGKRAHTETGLDRAGLSLVEAGLEQAQQVLGDLEAVRVLVLGAGSMGALAVATLQRRGITDVTLANRTPERAHRVAEQFGARPEGLDDLPKLLTEAELVIACAGATGHLVDAATVAEAMRQRRGQPQVYLDLALPRDVAPEAADVAGATVHDLGTLGRRLAALGLATDVQDVRDIIDEEVAAYLAAQRAQAVAPTVVALRAHARSVVDAELARLETRLSGIDARVRAEVEQTVHRVVEKLLHTPTVRVKELASAPGGGSYAEALRELFDLAPNDVTHVRGLPAAEVVPVHQATSLEQYPTFEQYDEQEVTR